MQKKVIFLMTNCLKTAHESLHVIQDEIDQLTYEQCGHIHNHAIKLQICLREVIDILEERREDDDDKKQ